MKRNGCLNQLFMIFIRFTLLIFLTSTISFGQENNKFIDTIWVKPGIGIDNIRVMESSEEEVSAYRNLDFFVGDGVGTACGPGLSKGFIETHYIFCPNGLQKSRPIEFVFSNRYSEDSEKKLEMIMLKNTKTINTENRLLFCLENGLCTGSSTYKEVIKTFGKPLRTKKDKFSLDYNELGIKFRFTDEKKLNALYLMSKTEL